MPNSAIISAAKVRAPSRTKRRRWNSHLTLNLHGYLNLNAVDTSPDSLDAARINLDSTLSLKGSLSTRRIIREPSLPSFIEDDLESFLFGDTSQSPKATTIAQ